MLSREKLGYLPGSSDAIYLRQDMDTLEGTRRSADATCDDLLLASAELETEARRLDVPELLTKLLLQRANILMENQRYREAITALIAADQALGNLREYDLKVNIYAGLAEVYAHLQDWQAVFAVCDTGIQLVETYRYKVSGQYLQSAYLRSRIGLYARGVQAAYERQEYWRMLRWAELSKCRSVLRHQPPRSTRTGTEGQIEQAFRHVCEQIDMARKRTGGHASEALLMKRRTLWDLLLIQRAQAKAEEPLPDFDLAAVQCTLDADEAVLYYYWLDPHSLLMIVIDRTQVIPELRSITSPERTELTQFARGILESLTTAMPSFLDYVDQVREFAAWLFPQAAALCLQNKRRLLISPHRLLHALPFHVLPWDDEHRYLIQRFAITYIPNLSSLLLRYQVPVRSHVLALGVCEYRVPGRQLDSLKEAEMEVDDLQHLYMDHSLDISALRGPEACEARLGQLEQAGDLGAFTCLHIATHGYNVNSDTPMESYLYLQDSILEGLEIANWPLSAQLVVLSACCSGQRPIGGRGMDELPGDDLFGLQAAFFAAGAKRVVGTLWPVNSGVARTILTAFHRFLIADQTPELALQSAVLEYLKNAGLRLRKSFFWAPFFLSAVGRPIAPTEYIMEVSNGRDQPAF